MSDPENPSPQPDFRYPEDIEREHNERKVDITITRRQADVLLVTLHREITDTIKTLEEMKTTGFENSQDREDYNTMLDHVQQAEALLEILKKIE